MASARSATREHQGDAAVLGSAFADRESVQPAAGKSSLTVQFVDQHFVDSYYPTIENTFQKLVKHKGQEYQLDIIDTAGQVRRVDRSRLS